MRNFALSCALLSLCSAFAANTADTYHHDHRAAHVKLHFAKNTDQAEGLTGEQRALDYLAREHARFGLSANLANLEPAGERTSLLGTHYSYRQMLAGYPVLGADLVVSVSHETGKVYRVYNNTYPVSAAKRALHAPMTLDAGDALDIAWQHLRVHGDLLAAPKAEAGFLPEGAGFRLVYRTQVSTEAPFGYWGHTIDAATGDILDTRSLAVSREVVDVDFGAYRGPVWDRAATTARYEADHTGNTAGKLLAAADGTGQVFDPDPVTTLANDTLEDGSAASNFSAAYFTRDLLDINLSGSTYSLTGPWVQIANFESPNTAPTTTTTGNWTGVRGNQTFNDAMTYFHIDQNQRYIQSLGFSGANGIQYGSIEADADGLSGADNSHYIPSSNRIAFGKGCVDDNEDAFVILHEYGHAIHHSINNNWSGGDTGGMGEGFGDYWGGSYRYSTPNGDSFHPEWAFPWDGHNNCWGGRLLNNTSGQYDPSKSYPAHSTVGGVLSDELWSAPLFQSLTRLTTNHGVPREEVDQIILEAHFGIGSGPSMRDMAGAIVATAENLYPTGPHADVFREEFEARNILAGGSTGGQTDTFNGTVASNGTNSHTITVSGGTISLNLSWSGGDLNLALYNPSGSLVASATGKRDNPEVITYNTGGNAGTYRIDVISNIKRKDRAYTVTANYTP